MSDIRVLLAHPGIQHASHLARELSQAGLLHRYWTGFAFPETGWEQRLLSRLPDQIRQVFQNRSVAVDRTQLRRMPLIEGWGQRAKVQGGQEAIYFNRNLHFQKAIPDREIQAVDVVVGYDTSSWILAQRAKDLGKSFILDQSTGHPVAKERLFETVRSRFPTWIEGISRKAKVHIEWETQEHRLADVVVVPSRFVERMLIQQGVNHQKIRVIPFGTDLDLFRPATDEPVRDKPLIYLFVGRISAPKGVPVLLEAWRRQAPPGAQLWLVGPGSLPVDEASRLPKSIHLLRPQSRQAVANLMQRADVFVFPSFVEGLAQVQIEAQASGLPLIATPEAGAEELIKPGHNGFLVPAGDAETLAARMTQLAGDTDLRLRMRQNAIERRPLLSWRLYGERWTRLLADHLAPHCATTPPNTDKRNAP